MPPVCPMLVAMAFRGFLRPFLGRWERRNRSVPTARFQTCCKLSGGCGCLCFGICSLWHLLTPALLRNWESTFPVGMAMSFEVWEQCTHKHTRRRCSPKDRSTACTNLEVSRTHMLGQLWWAQQSKLGERPLRVATMESEENQNSSVSVCYVCKMRHWLWA